MTIGKFACTAAALLLTAGCDVTVNNESVADQADVLGERLENAAESAGNRIDSAADAVENRVGDIDINVDTDGNDGVEMEAAEASNAAAN